MNIDIWCMYYKLVFFTFIFTLTFCCFSQKVARYHIKWWRIQQYLQLIQQQAASTSRGHCILMKYQNLQNIMYDVFFIDWTFVVWMIFLTTKDVPLEVLVKFFKEKFSIFSCIFSCISSKHFINKFLMGSSAYLTSSKPVLYFGGRWRICVLLIIFCSWWSLQKIVALLHAQALHKLLWLCFVMSSVLHLFNHHLVPQ